MHFYKKKINIYIYTYTRNAKKKYPKFKKRIFNIVSSNRAIKWKWFRSPILVFN